MDKKQILKLADVFGEAAEFSLTEGLELLKNAGIENSKTKEPNFDYITKGTDLIKSANESARSVLQMHKYGSDKIYR